MTIVVLDLEATCWKKGTRPERMEIIEFGAVKLAAETLDVVDAFASFVRPVAEPTLSDFCRELTSIEQSDVDNVPTFPDVFSAFLDWAGPGPITLGSWGAYDLGQLQIDCRRHQVPFPADRIRHVNLKKAFAQSRDIGPCGMKRALQILGVPLAGTHHRAIDDARNIAKIAREARLFDER